MALVFQMLIISPTHIEAGLCSLMVRFAVTRKARRLILHWHITLVSKAFGFAFHTSSEMSESCVSVASLPTQHQRPSAPVNGSCACKTFAVEVPAEARECDDFQIAVLRSRLEYKEQRNYRLSVVILYLIYAYYF
jgi:hypothetical protein